MMVMEKQKNKKFSTVTIMQQEKKYEHTD
jgi:hypothetical protein